MVYLQAKGLLGMVANSKNKEKEQNRYSFKALRGNMAPGTLKNFFFNLIIFLTLLGFQCCKGFSLVVASGGYSPAVVCRLPVLVASLVADRGL